MLTCAVRVPVAEGVNLMLIVQVPPLASVPPQVPRPPNAKLLAFVPLIEKLLNVIAEPVLFVSVENSTALVVPTV